MTTLRTFVSSFRSRLLLAFALVVSVALLLVLVTLPRLIEGYLADQDRRALDSRTELTLALVVQQLIASTRSTELPTWILAPTNPMTIGDSAQQGLESNPQLTANLALADLLIEIAPNRSDPEPVYSLAVPLDERAVEPGQTRESIQSVRSERVPDCYYAEDPDDCAVTAEDERVVTVTLSNPFTSRAETTSTIAGVLVIAAVIGLVVAAITALILAKWLTDPVRRLTQASRALAEGRLETRVSVSDAGSPELAELGNAFNNMAERLQESIRIMSQDRDRSREFVADVSHELRTPIAALRTFNELLRDGAAEDPATRDEFLEQSARQLDRLDWMAANLLELSKLDSGLVALELRSDDLRAVVENAVQHAEPMAERKGVELLMHLPDQAVIQLHDPPRIGQVLTNLIGNAIKFTPAGGRVDVELDPTKEGAEISVTDTGVGITADELPYVFERFWRGARTPQERGAGSGLGLAIVKSIVDMHEGRIEIQSAPGSGTRVVVQLPQPVSVSSPSPAHG
jgi:signal transduction histidine kinase